MATTTKNRLSQAEKLSVIQARRRRGDITHIAQRTGFAVSTVSEALAGKFSNTEIVNAAYTMTRQRKPNK